MKITAKIEGGAELSAALQSLRGNVNAVLQNAAEAGAKVIQSSANAKAPGPHIDIEIDDKAKGVHRIWFNVGPNKLFWFYRFFETGAAPHEIDPKNGKALVFNGADGDTVRASVHHTGMAARPFLRPAMDDSINAATAAVGETLRRAIERGG